jgi:VanZ family protein
VLRNIFKPATPEALPTSGAGQLATPRILTGVLFGLCVLFIFYQTAIPFRVNLTRSGLHYRWNRSEWIPFLDNDGSWLSPADAIGNILLFIPFGFFLHHWKLARAKDSFSARASVLAGLVYSCVIEIFQLGLDRRTTSTNDVITNVAGTYLGVKLVLARPGLIGVIWNCVRQLAQKRPVLVAWLAIMLLQIAIALPPFDFTLQQENFQRQLLRWQYSWQMLPFSQNWLAFLQNFPHYKYMLATLIVTAGFGILLGSSWILSCRQCGPDSRGIFWGSTLAMLIFYPALTLLQFMVQSVRPAVFFPVAGISGVIFGALLTAIILAMGFRAAGPGEK